MANDKIKIQVTRRLFGCWITYSHPKSDTKTFLIKIPYLIELSKAGNLAIFKLFGLSVFLKAGHKERLFGIIYG